MPRVIYLKEENEIIFTSNFDLLDFADLEDIYPHLAWSQQCKKIQISCPVMKCLILFLSF
jgi:hypothetical protein